MRAFALRAALPLLGAAFLLTGCGAPPASTPTATSPTGSPGSALPSRAPGTACIDRADLADTADVPVSLMQSLSADLKASNAVQAKLDAATAVSALRALAAFVAGAQPAAAEKFRTAASEVEAASALFPGGQSQVDQAQADLTAGLTLARAVLCS